MASSEASPSSYKAIHGRFGRRTKAQFGGVERRPTPLLEGDLALESLFEENPPESGKKSRKLEGKKYEAMGCVAEFFFDSLEEEEEEEEEAEAAERQMRDVEEKSTEEEGEEDEAMGFVANFFFRSVEEEEAKAAERQRREAEDKAREAEKKAREAEEKKRREEDGVWRLKMHKDVIKSIRRYNRKTKCVEYIRFPFRDLSTFDLDEPSPVLAMRYTDSESAKDRPRFNSANIFSVKIVSLDRGFLLNVYGDVIVRDDLDYKCVNLFRRSRANPEYIGSEDQSLILTGPSRGLVLVDYIYIELDLKIKRDRGKDKQLSLGLLLIDGRSLSKKIKVRSHTLDSSLSTVEVRYAVVIDAVEATVEFEVLRGDFCGKITAHTTSIEDSIQDRIVLHDSRASGVVTSSDGSGIIHLWRNVVAVGLNEMLVFTIVPKSGNGATTYVERFTPFLNGSQKDVINCGAVKLHARVTWSVIDWST